MAMSPIRQQAHQLKWTADQLLAQASRSARALLLAILAALLATSALAQAQHTPSQTLTQVQWSTANGDAGNSWLDFDLPHRWSAPPGAALRNTALRMQFTAPEKPAEAWAVLLGHANNGGRVFVNGRFIGAMQSPDERVQVRWRRPHLLAIDPALLSAGNNTLLIETAYRGGTHVLADVSVGPLLALSKQYEWLYFLSTIVTWIGATLAAVIALLFGVFWMRRPDALLGLITMAAALWMVRSGYFLIEVMPESAQIGIEFLYYASTAGFALVMTLATLRLIGRRQPREERIAAIFAAMGPVLLLVTARHAMPYLDNLWIPVLLAMTATALVMAIIHRIRHREAPSSLLLAALAVAQLAAMHDYAQWSGWIEGAHIQLLNWAGPLALIALATPLVDRFVLVLQDAETARADLETRVREREQLLKRNYERLRESERLQAVGAERQRIMQDMHDGLGSQLLSSLMLVERGAVSSDQVAQVLRESIDDMRLAIDALSGDNAGLLSALGNLRFRMEPRLRAAGIELQWDARDLPEELDLAPETMLPILRIVQEAMTNALKHSQARIIEVSLSVEHGEGSQWLDIKVTDNGRGITEERVGGRGLINMRNRAQKLGAQLKFDSFPGGGTMVQLRYRLDSERIEALERPSTLNMNTQAIIEKARLD